MDPNISRATPINSQSIQQLQAMAAEETMQLVEAAEDFQTFADNPAFLRQRFKTLQELKNEESQKPTVQQPTGQKKVLSAQAIDEAAVRYQQQNEELKAKTLLILRSSIITGDSPAEVLNKILRVYPDHALADEALEFLIETSDGPLEKTLRDAKEEFNRSFQREITAGRNIGAQSREFSKEGLGSPSWLRDFYRDLTGNPREPLKLFAELTQIFQYQKLKTAILFLLHALGADLKAKGSSIPRGELKRLIDEIRSLQGILGVFRFFQSRIQSMERQFDSFGLPYPETLTFEELAKIFIKMLAERFVNPEKILQFAKAMGIDEKIAAQIIVFTQYRDALKQISPTYYRNPQHKEDLLKALFGALEELEDALEEEEEKEEDKDK
jgi:type III secretion protein W